MDEQEALTLQYAIQFIDLMALRGAIKGEELYDTGLIRNNLTMMINRYNESQTQANKISPDDVAESLKASS